MPNIRPLLSLACLFLLAISFGAHAQPDHSGTFNDHCKEAHPISEGVFRFNNTTATNDYGGACGLTATARDIWWSYTPTGSGSATWSTCGRTELDTVLTAITSCGGAEIACSDDFCGSQTRLTFPVKAGQPVLLRLAGYNDQVGFGTFTIALDAPAPNDACENAEAVGEGTHFFSTWNATEEGPPGVCAPVGRDVWFRYTASQSGTASVSSCDQTELDAVIEVYQACGGAFIACSEPSCGLQGTVSFEAITGVSYLIRVDAPLPGFGDGAIAIRLVDPQCTAPPAGMLAWWPLDEKDGSTAIDLMGTAQGAFTAPPQPALGMVLGAQQFTGAEVINAVGPGTHTPLDLSMDAWINPSSLPASGTDAIIVGSGSFHYAFALTSTGQLLLSVMTCPFVQVFQTTVATIPLNAWSHVAVTGDATTGQVNFYVNGVAVGPVHGGYGGACGSAPNQWQIGQDHIGSLDEVEVFTRALDAADVRAIFDAGARGKCRPCVPAPHGMVAWWPLDEAGGNTSAELLHGNNGEWVTPVPTGGMVDGALSFSSSRPLAFPIATPDDVVQAPHNARFDFPSGNMSADMWVYWDPPGTPTAATLVSKHDDFRMMAFHGSLGFHIHLGPGYFGTRYDGGGAMSVPYREWTHLAVTLDQDLIACNITVKFYKNGKFTTSKVDSTKCFPFTRASQITLGGSLISEPFVFEGVVDEVEIFDRVLDEDEVKALYLAGNGGKCKFSCYAPLESPLCVNENFVDVQMAICNLGPRERTYQVVILPASGAACSAPSPSSVTFLAANPVTVPGQTCLLVPVRIQRPPGLLPGQHSCYTMQATDVATGASESCSGSLLGLAPLCVFVIDDGNALSGMNALQPRTLVFGLTNTTAIARPISYEFAALPANMEPGESPVNLNGLPPGKSVSGTLVLGPGETAPINIRVRFAEHDPLRFHDLVLRADINGDAIVSPDEVVIAAGLRSLPPTPCRCDWNQDAVLNSQDFFEFLAGFFGGSADYNGDGVTTSRDFFDFLGCFFAQLPGC